MSYFAADNGGKGGEVAQQATQAFNKAKAEGEKALDKAGAATSNSALSKDEVR